MNEFGDTIIAPRVSMISGVAQVLVYGSQKYAVRVQLDPQLLANRKIGIDEVSAALAQWNINLPTGGLQEKSRHLLYRQQDSFTMQRHLSRW